MAKLASYGTRSLYFSYLGGTVDDEASTLRVDAAGCV